MRATASAIPWGAIAAASAGLGLWALHRRHNAALQYQADWLCKLANDYLLDLGNLAYEHVEGGVDNLAEQSRLLDKILITIERANAAHIAASEWMTRSKN